MCLRTFILLESNLRILGHEAHLLMCLHLVPAVGPHVADVAVQLLLLVLELPIIIFFGVKLSFDRVQPVGVINLSCSGLRFLGPLSLSQ